MWLMLIAAAIADAPPKPKPHPLGELECVPVSIIAGKPIPDSLLLMGRAGCNAEVVPKSELATLYSIEAWADRIESEYRLDIRALEMEIEFHEGRNNSIPWGDRPEVQRWFGRLDVIIPVAIGIIVAGVLASSK